MPGSLSRLATCAALAGLVGCLTPPAVFAPRQVDFEAALATYPPDTETVELGHLRGVFVPAGEGAPVVLHLLESSGSVASPSLGYGALFRQLADFGFASLAIDYTGVGESTGGRSPSNLESDVSAFWEEAVHRAGGEPSRVVLRGISLGTLAAALLVRDGVRPGAVVLVAPVRAETAAERFAQAEYGWFDAWTARVFFRDVADVDISRELARCESPLLVFASREDRYLQTNEYELLSQSVASDQWVERRGDHEQLAFEARRLLPEERDLLRDILETAR